MKKIVCLYYSGVGNTRMVAEFIAKYLTENKKVKTDIYSIENLPSNLNYEEYDGLIIGFPTIHCSPPLRIMKYIDELKKIKKQLPTFVFTTCGLYQANTTRIFAKQCRTKNVIPALDAAYRMPAVDGLLLNKHIRYFETYEKMLKTKVQKVCDKFVDILKSGQIKEKIPSFKWYSILNYPNKLVGEYYVFPIYLNREKCRKCGLCTKNCPAKAFDNKDGYPIWQKEKCERCYRCMHQCPANALSLQKGKEPPRKWRSFKIE